MQSVKKATEFPTRYWTLDALRGCAVFLMILYHAVFITWYFPFGRALTAWASPSLFHPLAIWWLVVGRTASTLFLLLVGVSLYLSYTNAMQKKTSFDLTAWQRKIRIRGVLLLGYGLLLTAVTLVLIPELPIYFGVLSLIGVGLLFGTVVVQRISRVIASLCIALIFSLLITTSSSENSLFFIFGRTTTQFQTLDYWPIFPWIMLILLGILLAQMLKKQRKLLILLHRFEDQASLKSALSPFIWLGSHALTIYLIHVPVLFVVLRALTLLLEYSGILLG